MKAFNLTVGCFFFYHILWKPVIVTLTVWKWCAYLAYEKIETESDLIKSTVSRWEICQSVLCYHKWIFLSQETQIPVTWKPVFRSGNHHWLAWLILIRNRTNVKPRAALRGISRLYICEISCILYNYQSVSLSPDCVDTETGIFNKEGAIKI